MKKDKKTKPKKSLSIRLKLTLVIVLAVVLSTAGLSTLLITENRSSMLEQMKLDGINMVKIYALHLENIAEDNNDLSVMQEAMDEIGKSEGMEYACLIDKNYIDVADSSTDDIGSSWSDDEGTVKAVDTRELIADFWTDDDGKKILDIMYPVDFNIGDTQIAVADIGISLDNVNALLYKSAIKSILFALLFIIYRVNKEDLAKDFLTYASIPLEVNEVKKNIFDALKTLQGVGIINDVVS